MKFWLTVVIGVVVVAAGSTAFFAALSEGRTRSTLFSMSGVVLAGELPGRLDRSADGVAAVYRRSGKAADGRNRRRPRGRALQPGATPKRAGRVQSSQLIKDRSARSYSHEADVPMHRHVPKRPRAFAYGKGS